MALNVSLFRLLFGGEAAVTDRKISSRLFQRVFDREDLGRYSRERIVQSLGTKEECVRQGRVEFVAIRLG